MHNEQSIQSKNYEIKWKMDLLPHSGRLTSANIIRFTPGITKYATSRITDVICAFQTVFNSTIENKFMKRTHIEGRKVYGKEWKNIKSETYKADI